MMPLSLSARERSVDCREAKSAGVAFDISSIPCAEILRWTTCLPLIHPTKFNLPNQRGGLKS